MVSGIHTAKHEAGLPGALPAWLDDVGRGRGAEECAVIRAAAERAIQAHAGQTRASGEPFVTHAFAVASILNELELDHEAIAAALLHDTVEDTDLSLDDVRAEFGEPIARLVDGVTKMDVIEELSGKGHDEHDRREAARAESLRKMLLAMVEDVRVVLIKLADRLHNLRTLKPLARERQIPIARETLDVFAPLANRLGVWQLKWELEDLSFRYLEPKIYRDLARSLAERRVDRETYIRKFTAALARELESQGVHAEVQGRPKHIYSIWAKMNRKHVDFDHIFDVRAVRILCQSVRDCYAALGIVHTQWPPVAGEFDDYIATPKENQYRSIHTAVIGPEGKTVEVQIRTHDMHEQNELGVAAHWRYKEGRHKSDLDDKILWLRQLLEWKDEVADASDFIDRFKAEVFEERVYVFTPQGSIIDLPQGATPIDFAYAIHTEVGHRCRGAKVNGRIVPLTYALQTGEQVEVLTVKKGGPSRDWLNAHLGYTKTPRARSRIQRWFRQEHYEEHAVAGRQILDKELHRMGLGDVNLEKLARKLDYAKQSDMYAAIADGELKLTRYINAAQSLVAPESAPIPVGTQPARRRQKPTQDHFKISGVGNLLTHLGNCCSPLPGDSIVGYITRGRGVTIHRKDCGNALRYRTAAPERLVEVEWGDADSTYPIELMVIAYDRQGLLHDITAVLADAKINVLAVNTTTEKDQHTARIALTVEISDIDKLSRVLSKIGQLPNVIDARRYAPHV